MAKELPLFYKMMQTRYHLTEFGAQNLILARNVRFFYLKGLSLLVILGNFLLIFGKKLCKLSPRVLWSPIFDTAALSGAALVQLKLISYKNFKSVLLG